MNSCTLSETSAVLITMELVNNQEVIFRFKTQAFLIYRERLLLISCTDRHHFVYIFVLCLTDNAMTLRACSHGGGGFQEGEVPHLSGVTNLSIH